MIDKGSVYSGNGSTILVYGPINQLKEAGGQTLFKNRENFNAARIALGLELLSDRDFTVKYIREWVSAVITFRNSGNGFSSYAQGQYQSPVFVYNSDHLRADYNTVVGSEIQVAIDGIHKLLKIKNLLNIPVLNALLERRLERRINPTNIYSRAYYGGKLCEFACGIYFLTLEWAYYRAVEVICDMEVNQVLKLSSRRLEVAARKSKSS